MYRIAFRMLVKDRAKYLMLISALTFASLLITQQTSVFVGLMRWTTALLQNTQVPLWVMDPNVEQVNEAKPLLKTDLMRIRSVSGVAWAVPFYSGVLQAKLYNGHFKSIQLIGLDSSSLVGAPPVMLRGRLEDLYQANAVILDLVGIEKLSEGRKTPLDVGDIFEINDHEVRIVGICEAARSFFGYPFIYTTFDRALQISPTSRKNLTFILVQPAVGISKEQLAGQIAQITGLKALTDDQFFWSTYLVVCAQYRDTHFFWNNHLSRVCGRTCRGRSNVLFLHFGKLAQFGSLESDGRKQRPPLPHAAASSFYGGLYRLWHRGWVNCPLRIRNIKKRTTPFLHALSNPSHYFLPDPPDLLFDSSYFHPADQQT